MVDSTESNPQLLVPPVVTTLRQEYVGRGQMERTESMDIRAEREDLQEAAEQSLNIVLDLGLDETVRWVSPSWKDVIGTPVESVQGKKLSEIEVLVAGCHSAFSDALESMKRDDSRSQLIRFKVRLGAFSVLRQRSAEVAAQVVEDGSRQVENKQGEGPEEIMSLEGQGIMVHDRSSSSESHVSPFLWNARVAYLN